MANRFQTPVDNTFINTYVPIPFKELMDAAAIKQQRWDTAADALSTAEAGYKAVNAIEGTPDAAYRDEVVKYVNDRAAYYTSGNVDLSDPLVQNQLRGDLRNIDTVRLQNIATSRANWDAERAQEAELRKAGQWNENLYNAQWGDWDSRKGIYSGNAEAEIKTSAQLQPYFDRMKEEFKGIYGYSEDDAIKYFYSENGRNKIQQHAANIAPELARSAWGRQQLALGNGFDYAENMSQEEQDAYIQDVVTKYANELYPSSSTTQVGGIGGSGSGSMPKRNVPSGITFNENAKNNPIFDSLLDGDRERKLGKNVQERINDTKAKIQAQQTAIKANIDKNTYNLNRLSEADRQAQMDELGLTYDPETGTYADPETRILQGELNFLETQTNLSKQAAEGYVAEGVSKTAATARQDLVNAGVGIDKAEELMSTILGKGIKSADARFMTTMEIAGATPKQAAKQVLKSATWVVDAIRSVVPNGYYDINSATKDRLVKNDADIKANFDKFVEDRVGTEAYNGYTVGDYLTAYFDAIGARMDAAKEIRTDTFGPNGVMGQTEAETIARVLQKYKQSIRGLEKVYDDKYSEELLDRFKYMTQTQDITLPTYYKLEGSVNGYGLARDENNIQVEAAIPKFINNIAPYADGFIITSTGKSGSKAKSKEDKVTTYALNQLSWNDVTRATISSDPSFDENGNPYFSIKVGANVDVDGKSDTDKEYRDLNIRIPYGGPQYNKLKRDLYFEGSAEGLQAYNSLTDIELPMRFQNEVDQRGGATFEFVTPNEESVFFKAELDRSTGGYKITSDDVQDAAGNPIEYNEQFKTREQALEAMKDIRNQVAQARLQ